MCVVQEENQERLRERLLVVLIIVGIIILGLIFAFLFVDPFNFKVKDILILFGVGVSIGIFWLVGFCLIDSFIEKKFKKDSRI